MANALIGCSGFVGSTLLRQARFQSLYRSTNIGEIDGRTFELVVCAGAPAQKWLANKNPDADWQAIDGLISHLKTVRCDRFVLISTVDVFKAPIGVTEDEPVAEDGLHAYGLHRRRLESFVERQFQSHLIVRLPGLVGPGLRKNVIFDFLNNNNVDAIDCRAVFQFYPMVNLWYDVNTSFDAGLNLVHLTAEPIIVEDLSMQGFGRPFTHVGPGSPATYDMRTRYAHLFGAAGHYQYNRQATIQAVRAYAQSEPLAGGSL